MSIAVAALVRVVAVGAALAAYYAALPLLFPDDGGGANIGAGLIAFGALALISFGWAFVDGAARGVAPAAIIWAIVAAALSIGWLVVRAVIEADASMSASDLIRHDLGGVPFTRGLVLVPAVVGAVVGGALRPAGSSH